MGISRSPPTEPVSRWMGDTSHDVRVGSQPTATGTRLLLDREDVVRLARSYATPLTDAEITLEYGVGVA
jgi:hypothetical protein